MYVLFRNNLYLWRNNSQVMTSIYSTLLEAATAAGTNLSEVCREAGVNRSTVELWKRRQPKTLEIIDSMFKVIEQKAAQNAAAPSDRTTPMTNRVTHLR
jgi:transposase-like protein